MLKSFIVAATLGSAVALSAAPAEAYHRYCSCARTHTEYYSPGASYSTSYRSSAYRIHRGERYGYSSTRMQGGGARVETGRTGHAAGAVTHSSRTGGKSGGKSMGGEKSMGGTHAKGAAQHNMGGGKSGGSPGGANAGGGKTGGGAKGGVQQ